MRSDGYSETNHHEFHFGMSRKLNLRSVKGSHYDIINAGADPGSSHEGGGAKYYKHAHITIAKFLTAGVKGLGRSMVLDAL